MQEAPASMEHDGKRRFYLQTHEDAHNTIRNFLQVRPYWKNAVYNQEFSRLFQLT